MELMTLKNMISGLEIFSQPTASWNKENSFQTGWRRSERHTTCPFLNHYESRLSAPTAIQERSWSLVQRPGSGPRSTVGQGPQHQSILLSLNHNLCYTVNCNYDLVSKQERVNYHGMSVNELKFGQIYTLQWNSGLECNGLSSPVPTHLLDIKDTGRKLDCIESAGNSGLP